MSEKQRLDIAVTQKYPEVSRERAKSYIMAGNVFVNNQKMTKAGTFITPKDDVELRITSQQYVSRGGHKLEKAISEFSISLDGKVCIDVGASTGGFTDCMLQNGASKVYAVDVGYGQLDWKLRSDDRVVSLERTNVRYITEEQIPETADFVSIDVSFISLKLVLPVIWEYISENGELVALIKPQFEAGREFVGKHGVVRDKNVHLQVIKNIVSFCLEKQYCVRAVEFSPIKGPQGNIEYLLYLSKKEYETNVTDDYLSELIEQSHMQLDGE